MTRFCSKGKADLRDYAKYKNGYGIVQVQVQKVLTRGRGQLMSRRCGKPVMRQVSSEGSKNTANTGYRLSFRLERRYENGRKNGMNGKQGWGRWAKVIAK
jgi:hypothetical protein